MFEWLKTQLSIELLMSFLLGFLFISFAISYSPILAAVAVIGLCTAVLLFFYPNLGLLLIVALVPLERFGRFTDDSSEFTISLMRITGMLVLGVFILRRLLENKTIVIDKTFFIYLGYCFAVLISLTYTSDGTGTLRATSAVIANLLFLFLVINLISSRKLLVQALIVWLCVSAVIGIYSIYDWHLGSGLKSALVLNESDPGKGVQSTSNRWTTIWHDAAELETLSGKSLKRTMGSTSHSAVYGINLVLTVPFLLFFLKFAPRPWQKILILGVSAVIAYNILLTNTRSTILLTGVVGLMCWHKGLVKLTPSVLIIGGLTVILAGIFIIPEDIYNRVLDISNYSRDHSASLRIREEYIRAGLKAFGDSWLIGHGAANETLIPSYLPRWISAPSRTMTHNIYLQTLAELGVIGGLLLFSFVGILLKYCYQTIARLERIPDMKQEIMLVNAIKISMIATLIYGLQVDVFHFPLKGWWMLAGMTVFLHRFSLSHSTNNTANKS